MTRPPMSRQTVMDHERLAAFVDGELSPEDAAAVVMHLADHPEDQAYVNDLMASNVALSEAFAAPLDQPVPQALRDLILGTGPAATAVEASNVLPFPEKQASGRRPGRWGGIATGAVGASLAAGLALAIFLPGADPHELVPGLIAADSAIHQALARLPAGSVERMADGAELMILTSVPTPSGFCREIEVIHADAGRLQAALACTAGSGWKVEVVVVEALADAAASEGFGTASGDEAQSFTPFLDRLGAGAVLTPEEEQAAIAKAWSK